MGSSSVSSNFSRAVARALRTLCKDGNAVPAPKVAAVLRKSGKFGIANDQLLKLMVSQAVAEGSVPGYEAIVGRSGGIYSVAQRDAYNASVAA